MTFTSQFGIGDHVYFYNPQESKIDQGDIKTITMYCDGPIKWSYGILPDNKKDDMFPLYALVNEQFIFSTRDGVFEFAYKITENI